MTVSDLPQLVLIVAITASGLAPARPITAGANVWASLGPNGAAVTALAVDPSAPATWYAATSGNGVFKSTNYGASWSPANTGLLIPDVTALAIDPATPDTLYAGISANCWSPPPPCSLPPGLYKSLNGGGNWSPADTGLPVDADALLTEMYVLAIDPQTPAIVYAGTNEGLFKSTDGSASWQPANTGLADAAIHALVINPITPTTLYAGVWGGVYKSTDGAAHWSLASSGLPQADIHALVIDPQTPATLYAWVWGFQSGVYKTTDGGASWQPANTGLPTDPFGGVLAINPESASTLYVGTALGVFKSISGGASWSPLNNDGLTNTAVTALAIDPETPDLLYAGTGGAGVFSIQQALAVTGVLPMLGLTGGGTAITIHGWNFAPGALVTVGGVAATNVTVINPATLTAVTGAHAPGAADVIVTEPGHARVALENGFIYADVIYQYDFPMIGG